MEEDDPGYGYGTPMPGAQAPAVPMGASGIGGRHGQFPRRFGAPPDGEIDLEELQRYPCRLMISMLDGDLTGKVGFNEFKEVSASLNGWKENFMMFNQLIPTTCSPFLSFIRYTSSSYKVNSPITDSICCPWPSCASDFSSSLEARPKCRRGGEMQFQKGQS
uniref:Uncharacterized protein n=1 Tax=Erpetoichthys calabaricus TaxID=27687 RepID=A0A8C4TQ85_ERPCA